MTQLRLVEWNVAMSLDKKAHVLSGLNPTVAILPESACPEKVKPALEAVGATSIQWVGSNPNKGLTAAAFGPWTLRIDDSYDPGYQWVMPLHLSGPSEVRLLAVWDFNHRGSGHDLAKRLGSCRASLEHYEEFLSGDSDLVVITGDFNNSVYWDKPNSSVKFGDFMNQLESRGYFSAYHLHHGCERGAEPDATLWWMKDVEKTYHIDYAFVSRTDAVQAVKVGASREWLAYSDHAPLIVDLLLPATANRDGSFRETGGPAVVAGNTTRKRTAHDPAVAKVRECTVEHSDSLTNRRSSNPMSSSSLHDEILALLRRADCHYGAALRDEEEGLSVEEAAFKRDQVLTSRIVQLRRAVNMVADGEHSANKTQGGHEDGVLRALLHLQGQMSSELRQHIFARLANVQAQFALKRTTDPLGCVTRGANARRR